MGTTKKINQSRASTDRLTDCAFGLTHGDDARSFARSLAHAEGSSGKTPREGLPNASARATPPLNPNPNPNSRRWARTLRAGEDAVEPSTSMASSVHPPPGVGSVVVVVVIVDTELVGLVVVVVVVRPPRTDAWHTPPPIIMVVDVVPASRTSTSTSTMSSLACFANRPSPTPAHSTYVDVDRPRFHPVIVIVSRRASHVARPSHRKL